MLKLCQIGFISSMIADYHSGIRLHGDNRFHESNAVLSQNRGIQAGAMGISTGFTLLLTRYEYLKGHKRLALGILIGGTIVHAWAAGHNWKLRQNP